MLSRREFMQMAAVTAGIYGTTSNWNRLPAPTGYGPGRPAEI
jgi:hypothetical protein